MVVVVSGRWCRRLSKLRLPQQTQVHVNEYDTPTDPPAAAAAPMSLACNIASNYWCWWSNVCGWVVGGQSSARRCRRRQPATRCRRSQKYYSPPFPCVAAASASLAPDTGTNAPNINGGRGVVDVRCRRVRVYVLSTMDVRTTAIKETPGPHSSVLFSRNPTCCSFNVQYRYKCVEYRWWYRRSMMVVGGPSCLDAGKQQSQVQPEHSSTDPLAVAAATPSSVPNL